MGEKENVQIIIQYHTATKWLIKMVRSNAPLEDIAEAVLRVERLNDITKEMLVGMDLTQILRDK